VGHGLRFYSLIRTGLRGGMQRLRETIKKVQFGVQ
jgi:hypothetical protein